MLFLVDEFYKYTGKTITITFGKPIPISTFDNRKSDQEWAALLREHVIHGGHPREHDGGHFLWHTGPVNRCGWLQGDRERPDGYAHTTGHSCGGGGADH